MAIREERGGRFKKSRSDTHNRKILKKYKGGRIAYGDLYMALPTNTYQENENSNPDRRWIDFKCDVCGFVHSIKTNHTIDKDGNVQPSVGRESVSSGCGFHEWVKLEDWIGE